MRVTKAKIIKPFKIKISKRKMRVRGIIGIDLIFMRIDKDKRENSNKILTAKYSRLNKYKKTLTIDKEGCLFINVFDSK
jgi:hypothetical protein